jgi:hypothetical protein
MVGGQISFDEEERRGFPNFGEDFGTVNGLVLVNGTASVCLDCDWNKPFLTTK